MTEGLFHTIIARKHKVTTKEQRARLDNACSHYQTAIQEIKDGIKAIEQLDKLLSE